MTRGEYEATAAGGVSSFDALDQATIAAHELKAPLALVRQLSLELQSTDLSVAERARVTDQIRLTSERALRLSTNLTRSSRLQAELFPSEPVNVVELCRELGYEMKPLYSAHDRSLKFKSNRLVPLAAANHDLLRRIIACFVDNALHYSSEDGVVELYTQLLRDKQQVRVGVRDYGPTIPAQVWRDMQRGDISTSFTQRPESSGLGLYIAHRFADVIHGQIGAIRHRDGASFYVDVPMSKQLSLL